MEKVLDGKELSERNRRVSVLPPHVVEKIAAGEVVERPSSVLKELVENSLDAGARRIVVRAEGGGVGSIEVSDDGCGMEPEDALEALKRHATSKIRSVEDLSRITTLGFRGEALSSIASVSCMEIVTRPRHREEATRILVEGGRILEVSPWGGPVGTRVKVEKLFYNVPARRKFLRSEATESHHLRETFLQLAIVRPDVGFEFHVNEKGAKWDLPPRSTWDQRVKDVMGEEVFEELYPIGEKEYLVEVEGFVSHPNFHRGAASDLRFYVNGRNVQDRGLLGAVLRAYGQLLPRGRYPVGVVHIKMPAGDLDVNVHPTKREVRFRDGRRVQELVFKSVKGMLRRQPWLRWPLGEEKEIWERDSSSQVCEPPSEGSPLRRGPASGGEQGILPLSIGSGSTGEVPRGEIRYLGQVGGTYLVFASEDGLLVMDQHAAHERVILEELRSALEKDGVPGQGLLGTILLELSPEEEETLGALVPILGKLGWTLEPFGRGCWRISSAPPWLRREEAAECMKEILRAGISVEGLFPEEILARVACIAASKAGKEFTPQEAERLLSRIRGVESRGLCPHGRPTFLQISISELQRRFCRG